VQANVVEGGVLLQGEGPHLPTCFDSKSFAFPQQSQSSELHTFAEATNYLNRLHFVLICATKQYGLNGYRSRIGASQST
jgi:hypothetical protein